MTTASRRDFAFRIGGWLLVAVSAVFLFLVARDHWHSLSEISLAPGRWLALAGLSLVYAASLFLHGMAWHEVLLTVGAAPPGPRHSLRAHTSALLAKYVPGNVFHFVGRHMIHRDAGMDDRRLALAIVLENLILLAAAACVVIVCLLVGGEGAVRRLAGLAAIGAVLGLTVMFLVMRRLTGARLAPAVAAMGFSIAFFTIMAAIVAAVASLLGAPVSVEIGGGGVAAWIVGFVTPGAPGGIGVREAAMVLFGGPAVPAEMLLLMALLFRLVTFAGDFMCALAGRMLFREPAESRATTS